jgi:hypothetical protein
MGSYSGSAKWSIIYLCLWFFVLSSLGESSVYRSGFPQYLTSLLFFFSLSPLFQYFGLDPHVYVIYCYEIIVITQYGYWWRYF